MFADEDELEGKIRGQVDQAREEGLDATLEIVTRVGQHAAHMIADVARKAGADVVVVGTRGHAPAGLLLGVTQRLLHIAPCPVLAVPAGKHESDREARREAAATVH